MHLLEEATYIPPAFRPLFQCCNYRRGAGVCRTHLERSWHCLQTSRTCGQDGWAGQGWRWRHACLSWHAGRASSLPDTGPSDSRRRCSAQVQSQRVMFYSARCLHPSCHECQQCGSCRLPSSCQRKHCRLICHLQVSPRHPLPYLPMQLSLNLEQQALLHRLGGYHQRAGIF